MSCVGGSQMKQSQKTLLVALCLSTNLITFLVVHSLSQSSLQTGRCGRQCQMLQSLQVPIGLYGDSYNVSDTKKCPNITHTVTPSTQNTPSCLCKLQNMTTQNPPISNNSCHDSHPRSNDSLPTIFVISPTYARLTQKSDLTSICITLMHIPDLVWIVVEDSQYKTELVQHQLEHCPVRSVHLNAVTPRYYKKDSWKPRGVLQRNTGLSWIRDQHTRTNCRGVVYFGDDDNSYDLRVFELMRKTRGVSVWPVGFSGGVSVEGPECQNGVVSKWHSGWGADRVFPIDMAGFAINLCLVMAHPSVVIGNDKKGKLSSPGYLESNFLEQLVEKESLECYAPSKEIIVWHVKTAQPDISRDTTKKVRHNFEV